MLIRTDNFQSLLPMLLHHQQHTISYQVFGKGPRLLFCLHGYGESGLEFAALGEQLGNEYTLVCPDLPLHGKTRWTDESFEVDDLYSLLMALAADTTLSAYTTPGTTAPGPGTTPAGRFSIAGYSMGGRLALSLAEKYPAELAELILIAPDGLKINFWYWLTTQTNSGNRLFRKTMQRPEWLFRAMETARSLRLLNQSIYKFTHRFLDDPRQREDLYARWTFFRHFRPNKKHLQHLIRINRLRTLLFFGKFDRIITGRLGTRFAKDMGNETSIFLLEAGHRLLKPSNAATIAEIILSREKYPAGKK